MFLIKFINLLKYEMLIYQRIPVCQNKYFIIKNKLIFEFRIFKSSIKIDKISVLSAENFKKIKINIFIFLSIH